MSNKRAYERFERHLRVRVSFDGREIVAVSRDISLGGIFLVTQEKVPISSEVKLHFRLPALKVESEISATVRFQNDDGIGLQFAQLRAKEVWALNQLFKGPAGGEK